MEVVVIVYKMEYLYRVFELEFSRGRIAYSDPIIVLWNNNARVYNLLAKSLKDGRLTNNVYKEWVTVPQEWTLREIEIDLDATLVTRDSSFVDDCLKKKQIALYNVDEKTGKGNNNRKKINPSFSL